MAKVELQAKVDNLRQEIDFFTALYQMVSKLSNFNHVYQVENFKPESTTIQKNRDIFSISWMLPLSKLFSVLTL